MDHLRTILPQPHRLILDKVCCQAEFDFDGGSYEDFPERTLDYGSRTREQWAALFTDPSDRFKSFLQSWRYFGIASKFLSSEESGSLTSKLTRHDDDSNLRVLDTTKLWDLVKQSQAYHASRHGFPVAKKNSIILSYSSILEKASQLEEAFAEDDTGESMRCSCHSSQSNGSPITLYQYVILSTPRDPLPKEFSESICLLLDVFANILAPEANEWSATYYGLKPFLRSKSLVTHAMENGGWCPWKIGELWNRFNISSMYCIAQFGRPDQPPHQYDHTLCTKTRCNFNQVESKGYKTLHESDCQGCSMITANEIELKQILESGSFPLIEHQLNGNHFKLKPFETGENNDKDRYVAISHVWSDGLGNPLSNGIPHCRFKSLTRTLNDFTSKSEKGKVYLRRNSLFWLDTICCPVRDGEHQNLAIGRMRDTYQQATEVLVLENSLLRCEMHGKPDYEIFLRILSSTWMTRLWTYQEGCLAQRLYFQLADGVYSGRNEQYNKLVKQTSANIASECTVMKSLLTHWFQLQLIRSHGLSGPQRLMSCAAAVRFRCTSQKEDEPLCLATVLGCHFSESVARDQEKAMQWFWSQSEMSVSFSSRILFLELDTLRSTGYRWAPLTLINSSRIGVVEHWSFPRHLEEDRASLEKDGLLVSFSGFALKKEWTNTIPSVFLISLDCGRRYNVAVRSRRDEGRELMLHGDCARHQRISFAPPQATGPIKLYILLTSKDFVDLRSGDTNPGPELLGMAKSSTRPTLLVYSTTVTSKGVPIVYKVGIADVWENSASPGDATGAVPESVFAVAEKSNTAWCCG